MARLAKVARAIALPVALIAVPPAASAQAIDPGALEAAALVLKPGQYLWRDLDPRAGQVAVVVSLPLQVAYVFRAGALVGVAKVSTGKPGKRTPTGQFTILQKRVFHRSNLYSNAPMPFMQRLTWTGIALHAGDNPGYPASHGCIRLPRAFAELLFGATAMGGAVAVVDGDWSVPQPRAELPTVVADAGALTAPRFATVTWSGQRPAIIAAALSVSGDEALVPFAPLDPPRRLR